MASTSRYGRPAGAPGGARAEEGREGGGGRGSAISPCPWRRRENGRRLPLLPAGEEPVAVALPLPGPAVPRLGAAVSVRGALGRSLVSHVGLCAAPGVAGG